MSDIETEPNQISRLPSESSAHWSKDRLHADVHRAVGGVANLLREVARIGHKFDTDISVERVIKRINFFTYELRTLTHEEMPDDEKLSILNSYFFNRQGFRCQSNSNEFCESYKLFLLSEVIGKRTGAAVVLELLYALMANSIGLTLEFVDLKPTCFLKLRGQSGTFQNQSKFIDITRLGVPLSSDELIATLHSRFSMTTFGQSSALESFTFETFISDYVTQLKQSIGFSAQTSAAETENLLFLQDTLVAYQPSNLQLLAERALMHRRLGNFKSSLADLKRYFAFHDRLNAPAELNQLFEDLVKLLDRNKTSIEVLE